CGRGRSARRQRALAGSRPARAVASRAPVLGRARHAERAAGAGAFRPRPHGRSRMTVSILTDSAAALPRDLAEQHAIGVVPMWLNVDGEARHEDEVPLAELLGRADVKTSGPTPGEFEAAAREHLGDDGELICTVASSMSATYDAAVVGTRDLGDRVRVLDTGTAAGAEALVVLAAADAAEHGAVLTAVVDAARRASSEVRL